MSRGQARYLLRTVFLGQVVPAPWTPNCPPDKRSRGTITLRFPYLRGTRLLLTAAAAGRTSWFKVQGSRFVVRGSWFVVQGEFHAKACPGCRPLLGPSGHRGQRFCRPAGRQACVRLARDC